MAAGNNRLLRLCLAALAMGGLVVASPATAQRAAPWGAAWPGEVEQGLETQGYVLAAPLVRRPGVYLADVTAGQGRYQRLIIDARSGRILEIFPAPTRILGPTFAEGDEAFGEPQSGVGPPLDPGFSGAPAAAATSTQSTYGGPANVHIPTAINPYGPGATHGTRPKPKVASIEHKVPGVKAPTTNPPLPPPAPRKAAKADDPGAPASPPDQPGDSPATEAHKIPPAAAPPSQDASTEATDKPKVNIVPPALFE